MRFYSLSILLLTTIFLSGCFGDPNFSNVPVIEINSINLNDASSTPQYQDSITVSINFQDGDGDLGLNDPDIRNTEIYAPRIIDPATGDTINNPFTNNYFVNIIRRNGSTFDTVIVNSFRNSLESNFDSHYPRVGDGSGAIEGRLDFGMIIPYRGLDGVNIFGSDFNFGETIFFEIQIADRALNLSNFVTSTEVILGSED